MDPQLALTLNNIMAVVGTVFVVALVAAAIILIAVGVTRMIRG
jgi:hypothetical protein